MRRMVTGIVMIAALAWLTTAHLGERQNAEIAAISTLMMLRATDVTSGEMSSLKSDVLAPSGWRGYRFKLHTESSPTRLAVTAVPMQVTTGSKRSFCIDDRNVIYEQESSSQPQVSDARCVDTSRPVNR